MSGEAAWGDTDVREHPAEADLLPDADIDGHHRLSSDFAAPSPDYDVRGFTSWADHAAAEASLAGLVCDLSDSSPEVGEESPDVYVAPPASHSLRARIMLTPEMQETSRGPVATFFDWFRRTLLRR